MLRRFLARASALATSSPSFSRLLNRVVPVLDRLCPSRAPASSSSDLSSSKPLPSSSGMSSFDTHLKLPAVGSPKASISHTVSANETDNSAGEEGSNVQGRYRGSNCLNKAEAKKLFLDAAKTEGIPRKHTAKAEDLSPEDVENLVSCFNGACKPDNAVAMQMIELRRICPSRSSVALVLSRLRKDYNAALAFFSWAMEQPDIQLSSREFHSMVVILISRRRFKVAMELIRKTARSNPSFVTPRVVSSLMQRYCAVGQAQNAIAAFDSLKDMGCEVGNSVFESLLSHLCGYSNIAKAEALLFREGKKFPFCTRRFNIVLRGWCEMKVSPSQAKRFWQRMGDAGLKHDVCSYGTMISCLSKVGDVNAALKLFGEMNGLGIEPDLKVCKAVLVALAKTNHMKEAMYLIRKMEQNRLAPDTDTLSSVFWAACRAGSVDDAVKLLDTMGRYGVTLSKKGRGKNGGRGVFDELTNGKDVMAVLEALKQARYKLPLGTYKVLFRKFFMLQDYDTLFMIWDKMCSEGPKPEEAYIPVVRGLLSNGEMQEAHRYYLEMRDKSFIPEPRAVLGFLVKGMKRP